MVSLKSIFLYSISVSSLMLLLLLYILGAARYIMDFEENTCEMTYMFEYPQYVRITLNDDIEHKYPRFGLYAYGEGFVTEKLRRMHFSGIPVLFVPGNAGSHEQVRSIASVSLRKSLKSRTPFHFDFFTVSLNKDYSALYGGVLMEQTTYVAHSIKKILSLYGGNMDSLILIGHSMGGIIAKGALLLEPSMNVSSASIIITLATPHTPSLVLDNIFATYYRNLESEMYRIKDAGISTVSIGGGPRDVIVTASQSLDPLADINALSTSIPDVWKSTDHQSILWCKQLVFAIVRSLFDSVNYTERPPRVYEDSSKKIEALSYHFLHRTSGKRLYPYKEKYKFESDGEWTEDIRKQFLWQNKPGATRRLFPVFLMIRLTIPQNYVTIETTNLETRDWLFTCSASSVKGQARVCDWGWNLTNKTRISMDHLRRYKRVVDLDIQSSKYPGMTHVIVRIPPDDLNNYVAVNVDVYSPSERILPIRSRISYGNFFSYPMSNLIKLGQGHTRYYADLGRIDAITIELKSLECVDSKQSQYAVVELMESWNPAATQVLFLTEADNGPRTVKVQTNYESSDATSILRISLNPKCSYTFNIQGGGLIDQISCLVRDRWSVLYIIIVGLLLISISIRMDVNDNGKILTVAMTLVLAIFFELTFETCIALAILCTVAICTCCSVIFFGSVAHTIAIRFLARAITFSTTWSDWLLGGLNQLPAFTAILVLSLAPATCGALSMIISVFLYFLKLTRMYEDYLEELLMASLQYFNLRRSRTREENNETNANTRQQIFDHLIFFLLWCFAAIPAVPSVLVWAKNFSYDTRLSTEDPILLATWIVLTTCSILDLAQISPTRYGDRHSWVSANVSRLVGWITFSIAAINRPSFYQWYIPPIVALTISFISLNSIFGNRISR